MDWSVEGQSPQYLAVTRMATLAPAVIEEILRHLELKPGMKVLDVGCGSGEYVFRLGHIVEGVHFVGIDFDQGFVDVANERATGLASDIYEAASPQNTYEFVQGDGLELPFDDGAFDAVISHTYLTAIPDYQGALAEMIRVCRPGGQVSSITNMTSNFNGVGKFSLFPPVIGGEERQLINRVAELKQRMSYVDMGSGVPTHKVQRLFAHLCLEGVSAVPLGQYFCLSDAQTTPDDYTRYVDLLFEIEKSDVERMRSDPRLAGELPSKEWDAYLEVAEARHDGLIAMMGANQEWTWFGSTALLVWGRVPEGGLVKFCATIAEERKRANALRAVAALHDWRVEERVSQAGPGRVCRVRLTAMPRAEDAKQVEEVEDGASKAKAKGAKKQRPLIVEACGFNPSLAFEEAYLELLGRDKSERSRRRKAERACKKSYNRGKKPKPLADGVAYNIDLMWDTVAEAMELGYAVEFFDMKKTAGMPAILCKISKEGFTRRGIAAHEDQDVAIVRSLSRALGGLAARFA